MAKSSASSAAATDYDIKRAIWMSRVPVEFTLDPPPTSSGEAAVGTTSTSIGFSDYGVDSMGRRRKRHSAYMMLPRISYFPLWLPKALRFFVDIGSTVGAVTGDSGGGDAAADEEDEVHALLKDAWLEYGGVPLRWHYPIGVLYDLYNNGNTGEVIESQQAEKITVATRPWPLIIRTKSFPDELIRLTNKEALRSCFIQTLKEADQLKHKANVVKSMTAEEHLKLFDSIIDDRFDDFWSVNAKLMTDATEGALLHIPLRFYELSTSAVTFRQVLIRPHKAKDAPPPESSTLTPEDDARDNTNREETTLGDAIEKALHHRQNGAEPSDDDAEPASATFTTISHGIRVPLETPVRWLARTLAYPDNFVHMVLKRQ